MKNERRLRFFQIPQAATFRSARALNHGPIRDFETASKKP
jgi:hypothetical protein